MADERQRRPAAQIVGEGALDAMGEFVERASKSAGKSLGPAGRVVLKTAARGGGWIYDGAQWARAEDKKRATLGLIGGAVGGLAGSAFGPVGSVVGGSLGEDAATYLYDNPDAAPRALAETRRWMREREAQLKRAAGAFEHGFDRGLPPYAPSRA